MDLLWTAWMLGLVGSLHCAGMCGPLVLALPAPAVGFRAFGGGRVVYHAGRLVTYALLGAVFGLLGRTFLLAGFQQGLSITVGVVLLVGLALSPRAAAWVPVIRGVASLKRVMGGLLRKEGVASLGLLGLLNGLLPCGLVYVACAGAAATGGVVSGAFYMLLFGLGTVPVMLAISLSGRLLQSGLRRWLMKTVPISVGLVAVLLILRGLGLGIPYVSPSFAPSSAASCCAEPGP